MMTATDLRRRGIVGVSVFDASYPDWVVNPPLPTLTSLAPPSIVAGAAPTAVTLTGTNFTPASHVWADEEQQLTEYVSPTTLRYAGQADAAGSQTITVHNGARASNAVELNVTAAVGDDEQEPEPESQPVEPPPPDPETPTEPAPETPPDEPPPDETPTT